MTLQRGHGKDDNDDQYYVGDDRDNHDYDDRDEELSEWPTSLTGVCEANDAEDDDHDHDIGDGDQDDIELDLAEQPWVAHELEGKCQ